MDNLKELQKEEAIKRMKNLGIMPRIIEEFRRSNKLNKSEICGILYWLSDEEKKIVEDFESKQNALVYHVIKTNTRDGIMDACLYVSAYPEEWEYDREDIEEGIINAYVYNEDTPIFSEIGSIGVMPANGGLVRIA